MIELSLSEVKNLQVGDKLFFKGENTESKNGLYEAEVYSIHRHHITLKIRLLIDETYEDVARASKQYFFSVAKNDIGGLSHFYKRDVGV